MPKESRLELKVGLFVIAALFLLAGFIFSISDFSVFEKGQDMQVIFGFANGLKKSAPVRLAGVDCGLVRDINVFFDEKEQKTKVKVGIWFKRGIRIPVDSQATINQLGLLGEKYIEIIPGVSLDYFKSGDRMVGKDPIAMEKISEMVTQLASKVDKSVDGFNAVVNSEKNQKSFESILDGLNQTVTTVREGKGTIGKFFYDDTIYDDLHEFTTDLKANPWKLLYRPPKREQK